MYSIYNFSSYSELLSYAKSQNRQKSKENYYESHHIIPKFMGGTNDKNNLVLLTISEHCEAHYLLAMENQYNQKIYQGNICAAWLIIHPNKKYKNKITHIQRFLENENFQRFVENLKKNLYLPISFQHCWVQLGNTKPISRRIESLKKFLKKGYKHIDKCPICNQPNSENSFCCCDEHLRLFEEQRRRDIYKGISKTKNSISTRMKTRRSLLKSHKKQRLEIDKKHIREIKKKFS